MKLLSFAVPCYNSQAYMRKCVDSLLLGGDEVEIIIVDDGSKDRTAEIADEYAAKYPHIVKAVHQENGGHGEAVNAGIRNATGLYFKVVDSDDWVDKGAYFKIITLLKEITQKGEGIDLLVTNFVYDKEGSTRKKVMNYRTALPKNRIFGWKDVRYFHTGQYMLMHALIYRTGLLRECGLNLPKHTFYVDNIYAFEPLAYVKKMYYLNVNFYRYFIGRADQSVNETVMIGRIDQQIKVTKLMIDYMAGKKFSSYKLSKYMRSYLDVIVAVSSILLIRAGSKEALDKKKELWQYLKRKDKALYIYLRMSFLGIQMNLPGSMGRKVSVAEYKIAQKLFGFN